MTRRTIATCAPLLAVLSAPVFLGCTEPIGSPPRDGPTGDASPPLPGSDGQPALIDGFPLESGNDRVPDVPPVDAPVPEDRPPDGVASCASNGVSCGSAKVCSDGKCVDCGGSAQPCCGNTCTGGLVCGSLGCMTPCTPGGACNNNPGADNCKNGVWACASPSATRHCADDSARTSGGCQGDRVCNASGNCVARCQGSGRCDTNVGRDDCINGTWSCPNPAAAPVCTDDPSSRRTTGSCQNGSRVCNASGDCVPRCVQNSPCSDNPGRDACINGISRCQSPSVAPICEDDMSPTGKKTSGMCANGTRICDANGNCVDPCGKRGQPCCSRDVCISGNVCYNGTCQACGGNTQLCCDSRICNSGLQCFLISCEPCGDTSQRCCYDEATNGFTCRTGSCIDATGRCP